MEIHLKIIGITLIALGLVHVIFPRYFKWKVELKPLSLINVQMMYVHTFFLALTVLLMGVLCFTFYDDIINTRLGHAIALGLSIFWGFRLVFQFFVYSPSLWRGKTFETVVHIVFALFWTYMTVVFFKIWYGAYLL